MLVFMGIETPEPLMMNGQLTPANHRKIADMGENVHVNPPKPTTVYAPPLPLLHFFLALSLIPGWTTLLMQDVNTIYACLIGPHRGRLSNLNSVLPCPFASRSFVSGSVRLVDMGNLGDKRIIRVRVSQHGANG